MGVMEEHMFFAPEDGPILSQGQGVYVQQDYALDFVPRPYSDCSVLIGFVELGFAWFANDIKRANQVSGYCGSPTAWRKLQPYVPAFHPGRLLLLDETIEEGDIVRLQGSDTWDISYDPATSWVCFGETSAHKDDIAVAFATNCGAILRTNQLKALWVKTCLSVKKVSSNRKDTRTALFYLICRHFLS
jgi:hypothetical protein